MTRVKAEVNAIPEVQEAESRLLSAYARRKLVGTMWARVDRDAALLSRELTRRTGGEDPKLRRARGRFGT